MPRCNRLASSSATSRSTGARSGPRWPPMPEVTVLLPSYNAGPFLRPAIESILAQSYQDFELLVIDDASTDGSQEAVATFRDPRVRFVRHEANRGLGATLNEGLRLARGALIARQDCDDLS